MFIQTEQTPNPATLKFIPGTEIMPQGTAQFRNVEDAAKAPLAKRLLEMDHVTQVFYGRDFVSITKSDDIDWESLKPLLLAAIMDHFTAGFPVLEDGALEEKNVAVQDSGAEDNEINAQIRELIDTRVKPAVAQDGGNIEFVDFDAGSGVVYLSMEGACAGCPSSTMTLKAGIENMLKHYVPEVTDVVPVN